jgi:hypothetical protein
LHQGDLLGLFDDDPLGQTAHRLVLAVGEFDPRHVDRALMMGDHHGGEVAVGIAGRRDRHGGVHARHGLGHFRIEGGAGRLGEGHKHSPGEG